MRGKHLPPERERVLPWALRAPGGMDVTLPGPVGIDLPNGSDSGREVELLAVLEVGRHTLRVRRGEAGERLRPEGGRLLLHLQCSSGQALTSEVALPPPPLAGGQVLVVARLRWRPGGWEWHVPRLARQAVGRERGLHDREERRAAQGPRGKA